MALPVWNEPLCHRSNGLAPDRGYLSGNPRVEAVLQGLLVFGPTAWLLIGAPIRMAQLRGADIVVLPNRRGIVKAITTFALFVLESVHAYRDVSVAQLLSLVAVALVCVVSFLEHGRNVAPSALLTVYLVLGFFCNIVQAGLLHVARNFCGPGAVGSAVLAVRLVLLVVEGQPKRSILRKPYDQLTPEETAGYLAGMSYWWANDVIKNGYANVLSLEDLPPLVHDLDIAKARETIQAQWDKRTKPEGRFAIIVALLKDLWRQNLSLVGPRFCSVALTYCQPLLITRAITYASSELSPFESRNEAFNLVLFAFVIYVGLPLVTGIMSRLLVRLLLLHYAKLVGLVYNRTLTIKDGIFDKSAAVTLMNSDAEYAAHVGFFVHDLYSDSLGLAIGMYMLASEVGWVCIFPILVAIASSKAIKTVTVNAGNRIMEFSMATQKRISATKDVLDSIKNIKMMGIADKMETKVQAGRIEELDKLVGFNRLLVTFSVSTLSLHLFSPALTLIVYAIQAELRGTKAIDVNMAFTSIAIINLVASPINMLIGILPESAGMLAAFDRIQKYLLSPDREDPREHLDGSRPDSSPDCDAVSIRDATIRPAATADPVLKNISAVLKKGNLVVVSGAVGTGKTTLARAVLGDLPLDAGTIQTAFGTMAYCSQTPWLINGTVREAICGPSGDIDELDEEWYKRVVHACDLEPDLDQMPRGDQSVIGSRGITLSGGQKQRVALARAVYARQRLIILDDVLSALDAVTERHIVDNLIGPHGLFKELGTTVLLITHASQHLPLADHIIILDDKGEIAEQGSWDDLRADSGYISKVVLKEKEEGGQQAHGRTEARDKIQLPPEEPDVKKLDLARKTGDMTLYNYYFSAVGPFRLLLLLTTLSVYSALLAVIPYCLRWLGESNGRHMWLFTGAYFAFTVGAFVSVATALATVYLVITPHASRFLHDRVLHTVMHAPQSFFAATDTGTTLNRFSSDMSMIDRQLPISLFQVFQAAFRLLSQCVLLAVVQPIITATLPGTVLVVYVLQRVYLATSRQLRFLDLEARALVNASFLETLDGVATIRAFGWQPASLRDNIRKLELSMRPNYLLISIQRWLNLVLDLLVAGLALSVIVLAIAFKGTTTGGQIGIALSVILQLNNNLLRMVQEWTKLETSLGAVARVRSFEREVRPEDDDDGGDGNNNNNNNNNNKLPASSIVGWPSAGRVAFDHLSVSYAPPPAPRALDDLSVTVAPGTKVGVVGRTGSGKSTLLLSLLRLVEFDGRDDNGDAHGTIRIDGLDVGDLPRDALRARFITVPQDAMLIMTDTIRQNLDIADAGVSDEDMIRMLERVRLWDVLQARAAGAEAADREAHEVDVAMGAKDDAKDGAKDGAKDDVKDDAKGNGTANGNGSSSGDDSDDAPGDASGAATPKKAAPSSSTSSPTDLLNTTMKSLPLSHGQQQLFSLARALLMRPYRGRVVLLDEATSNVDGDTDKLMQELVREEFQEHTVITVAHRLDTIMDSDMVLVLDKGKLVETGPPSELATKDGGVFRALMHGKAAV